MWTLLIYKAYRGFSADGTFYRSKIEMAKFFCRNILPNVLARHTVMQQEDTSALDILEKVF